MSFSRGNAATLLSQGLAAAQSGKPQERSEAEFYFEWVLRTDADLDQQITAWYWLSLITDDPGRKRECLENVLAIRPGHPDARRDRAVMEGRLKPEQMRVDPLLSGAPVASPEQVSPGEARRFPCPKCGASVLYAPGAGDVYCQFCGTSVDAQGQVADTNSANATATTSEVSEQDWVAAIYTETGHRWALPHSRVLACEGCGATITFAPAHISACCLYCGSPYVVKVAGADLREPDGIVPFRFDAPAAAEHAREWLREQARQMGVPDDMPSLAAMANPSPIYLPFWTFDIGGEVGWSGWVRADADIGGMGLDDMDSAANLGGLALGMFTGNFDIAARGAANLASKRYGGSNLVHSSGSVGVVLDDVAVPATHSLPDEWLRKLKYATREAVPYRGEMLASVPAEVYSLSMADASLKAREQAVEEGNGQIALHTGELTGGGPAGNLLIDRTGLTVMSYKLLLLPLWTAAYTYRGAHFRLLINGQTAQVEGELPRTNNPVARLLKL